MYGDCGTPTGGVIYESPAPSTTVVPPPAVGEPVPIAPGR